MFRERWGLGGEKGGERVQEGKGVFVNFVNVQACKTDMKWVEGRGSGRSGDLKTL